MNILIVTLNSAIVIVQAIQSSVETSKASWVDLKTEVNNSNHESSTVRAIQITFYDNIAFQVL